MGRRKHIVLFPASVIIPDLKDQVMMMVFVYKMSFEEAKSHVRLNGMGSLYVTDGSRTDSEYQVVVNQGLNVPMQGAAGDSVAQLSIKRVDDKPGPIPWEDIQEIKRYVAGDDTEAIELYPSQKRLVSTPFRHIWIFPQGVTIPVGYDPERLDQFDLKVRKG